MRVILIAAMSAISMAMSEDSSTLCEKKQDCPKLPCHTLRDCVEGKCQYSQWSEFTLCPKQGWSNGGACDDDARDYCDEQGVCQDKFKNEGHVCQRGGTCYEDSVCTGEDGQCPANEPSPCLAPCKGTSQGGLCDAPDTCDGEGNCIDNFKSEEHVCRRGHSCFENARCTGDHGHCPDNEPSPCLAPCKGISNGGPCDLPDTCDGEGRCIDNYKSSEHICRRGGSCYEDATCDGENSFCPPNEPSPCLAPCKGKSNGGPCDLPDTCDGEGNCIDNFKDSSFVCRAGGSCYEEARCDGEHGTCPQNEPTTAGTRCEYFDVRSVCDGHSLCDENGNCIPTYLQGILCHKGATLCDSNYFCDGTSSSCPVPSGAIVYLDQERIGMATYLSDTVAQCSAKAMTVGSDKLSALYTTTTDHIHYIIASLAAIAVVAIVITAKKSDRNVILEDGYISLADEECK
ncbi:hypothetical protein THRCLA_08288 [Thraustotheca clavata]|uniref:Disintegrin domain-containing protein n=1 Tax=Thraustotheca clavata TaxID=74557 RepID=A0A1V9Z7Q2_9STRA|nr:hypothetical protein THRCLA_08288 [Thraustotheca clavata]